MRRVKYEASRMQMEFGNWKLKLEMELRLRLRKKEERLAEFDRMKPEDIDAITKRRIIAAYKAGVVVRDISRRFQLTRNTILHICCDEAGLPRRDTNGYRGIVGYPP